MADTLSGTYTSGTESLYGPEAIGEQTRAFFQRAPARSLRGAFYDVKSQPGLSQYLDKFRELYVNAGADTYKGARREREFVRARADQAISRSSTLVLDDVGPYKPGVSPNLVNIHLKQVFRPGAESFTSTGNLNTILNSKRGRLQQLNFAVRSTDPKVLADDARIADFIGRGLNRNSNVGGLQASLKSGSVFVTGPGAGPQFVDKLVRDINKAQQRVYIAEAYMTDPVVAEALVQAQQRGLDVRVYGQNPKGAKGGGNQESTSKLLAGLSAAGVEVYLQPADYAKQLLQHAKAGVIDSKLFSGSYNISSRSANKTLEKVRYLNDRRLADALARELQGFSKYGFIKVSDNPTKFVDVAPSYVKESAVEKAYRSFPKNVRDLLFVDVTTVSRELGADAGERRMLQRLPTRMPQSFFTNHPNTKVSVYENFHSLVSNSQPGFWLRQLDRQLSDPGVGAWVNSTFNTDVYKPGLGFLGLLGAGIGRATDTMSGYYWLKDLEDAKAGRDYGSLKKLYRSAYKTQNEVGPVERILGFAQETVIQTAQAIGSYFVFSHGVTLLRAHIEQRAADTMAQYGLKGGFLDGWYNKLYEVSVSDKPGETSKRMLHVLQSNTLRSLQVAQSEGKTQLGDLIDSKLQKVNSYGFDPISSEVWKELDQAGLRGFGGKIHSGITASELVELERSQVGFLSDINSLEVKPKGLVSGPIGTIGVFRRIDSSVWNNFLEPFLNYVMTAGSAETGKMQEAKITARDLAHELPQINLLDESKGYSYQLTLKGIGADRVRALAASADQIGRFIFASPWLWIPEVREAFGNTSTRTISQGGTSVIPGSDRSASSLVSPGFTSLTKSVTRMGHLIGNFASKGSVREMLQIHRDIFLRQARVTNRANAATGTLGEQLLGLKAAEKDLIRAGGFSSVLGASGFKDVSSFGKFRSGFFKLGSLLVLDRIFDNYYMQPQGADLLSQIGGEIFGYRTQNKDSEWTRWNETYFTGTVPKPIATLALLGGSWLGGHVMHKRTTDRFEYNLKDETILNKSQVTEPGQLVYSKKVIGGKSGTGKSRGSLVSVFEGLVDGELQYQQIGYEKGKILTTTRKGVRFSKTGAMVGAVAGILIAQASTSFVANLFNAIYRKDKSSSFEIDPENAIAKGILVDIINNDPQRWKNPIYAARAQTLSDLAKRLSVPDITRQDITYSFAAQIPTPIFQFAVVGRSDPRTGVTALGAGFQFMPVLGAGSTPMAPFGFSFGATKTRMQRLLEKRAGLVSDSRFYDDEQSALFWGKAADLASVVTFFPESQTYAALGTVGALSYLGSVYRAVRNQNVVGAADPKGSVSRDLIGFAGRMTKRVITWAQVPTLVAPNLIKGAFGTLLDTSPTVGAMRRGSALRALAPYLLPYLAYSSLVSPNSSVFNPLALIYESQATQAQDPNWSAGNVARDNFFRQLYIGGFFGAYYGTALARAGVFAGAEKFSRFGDPNFEFVGTTARYQKGIWDAYERKFNASDKGVLRGLGLGDESVKTLAAALGAAKGKSDALLHLQSLRPALVETAGLRFNLAARKGVKYAAVYSLAAAVLAAGNQLTIGPKGEMSWLQNAMLIFHFGGQNNYTQAQLALARRARYANVPKQNPGILGLLEQAGSTITGAWNIQKLTGAYQDNPNMFASLIGPLGLSESKNGFRGYVQATSAYTDISGSELAMIKGLSVTKDQVYLLQSLYKTSRNSTSALYSIFSAVPRQQPATIQKAARPEEYNQLGTSQGLSAAIRVRQQELIRISNQRPVEILMGLLHETNVAQALSKKGKVYFPNIDNFSARVGGEASVDLFKKGFYDFLDYATGKSSGDELGNYTGYYQEQILGRTPFFSYFTSTLKATAQSFQEGSLPSAVFGGALFSTLAFASLASLGAISLAGITFAASSKVKPYVPAETDIRSRATATFNVVAKGEAYEFSLRSGGGTTNPQIKVSVPSASASSQVADAYNTARNSMFSLTDEQLSPQNIKQTLLDDMARMYGGATDQQNFAQQIYGKEYDPRRTNNIIEQYGLERNVRGSRILDAESKRLHALNHYVNAALLVHESFLENTEETDRSLAGRYTGKGTQRWASDSIPTDTIVKAINETFRQRGYSGLVREGITGSTSTLIDYFNLVQAYELLSAGSYLGSTSESVRTRAGYFVVAKSGELAAGLGIFALLRKAWSTSPTFATFAGLAAVGTYVGLNRITNNGVQNFLSGVSDTVNENFIKPTTAFLASGLAAVGQAPLVKTALSGLNTVARILDPALYAIRKKALNVPGFGIIARFLLPETVRSFMEEQTGLLPTASSWQGPRMEEYGEDANTRAETMQKRRLFRATSLPNELDDALFSPALMGRSVYDPEPEFDARYFGSSGYAERVLTQGGFRSQSLVSNLMLSAMRQRQFMVDTTAANFYYTRPQPANYDYSLLQTAAGLAWRSSKASNKGYWGTFLTGASTVYRDFKTLGDKVSQSEFTTDLKALGSGIGRVANRTTEPAISWLANQTRRFTVGGLRFAGLSNRITFRALGKGFSKNSKFLGALAPSAALGGLGVWLLGDAVGDYYATAANLNEQDRNRLKFGLGLASASTFEIMLGIDSARRWNPQESAYVYGKSQVSRVGRYGLAAGVGAFAFTSLFNYLGDNTSKNWGFDYGEDYHLSTAAGTVVGAGSYAYFRHLQKGYATYLEGVNIEPEVTTVTRDSSVRLPGPKGFSGPRGPGSPGMGPITTATVATALPEPTPAADTPLSFKSYVGSQRLGILPTWRRILKNRYTGMGLGLLALLPLLPVHNLNSLGVFKLPALAGFLALVGYGVYGALGTTGIKRVFGAFKGTRIGAVGSGIDKFFQNVQQFLGVLNIRPALREFKTKVLQNEKFIAARKLVGGLAGKLGRFAAVYGGLISSGLGVSQLNGDSRRVQYQTAYSEFFQNAAGLAVTAAGGRSRQVFGTFFLMQDLVKDNPLADAVTDQFYQEDQLDPAGANRRNITRVGLGAAAVIGLNLGIRRLSKTALSRLSGIAGTLTLATSSLANLLSGSLLKPNRTAWQLSSEAVDQEFQPLQNALFGSILRGSVSTAIWSTVAGAALSWDPVRSFRTSQIAQSMQAAGKYNPQGYAELGLYQRAGGLIAASLLAPLAARLIRSPFRSNSLAVANTLLIAFNVSQSLGAIAGTQVYLMQNDPRSRPWEAAAVSLANYQDAGFRDSIIQDSTRSTFKGRFFDYFRAQYARPTKGFGSPNLWQKGVNLLASPLGWAKTLIGGKLGTGLTVLNVIDEAVNSGKSLVDAGVSALGAAVTSTILFTGLQSLFSAARVGGLFSSVARVAAPALIAKQLSSIAMRTWRTYKLPGYESMDDDNIGTVSNTIGAAAGGIALLNFFKGGGGPRGGTGGGNAGGGAGASPSSSPTTSTRGGFRGLRRLVGEGAVGRGNLAIIGLEVLQAGLIASDTPYGNKVRAAVQADESFRDKLLKGESLANTPEAQAGKRDFELVSRFAGNMITRAGDAAAWLGTAIAGLALWGFSSVFGGGSAAAATPGKFSNLTLQPTEQVMYDYIAAQKRKIAAQKTAYQKTRKQQRWVSEQTFRQTNEQKSWDLFQWAADRVKDLTGLATETFRRVGSFAQGATDGLGSALGELTGSAYVASVSAFTPLLRVIYAGEGGYNSVNRGNAGDTPGGLPGLSSMTFGEVMRRQAAGLHAVGAPQFIPSTLKIAMRDAGLKTTDVFSPYNQDRAAIALMIGSKQPALAAFLRGKSNNVRAAIDALAGEWASVKNASGRGQYNHVGRNRATITMSPELMWETRRRYLASPDAIRPTTPVDIIGGLFRSGTGGDRPVYVTNDRDSRGGSFIHAHLGLNQRGGSHVLRGQQTAQEASLLQTYAFSFIKEGFRQGEQRIEIHGLQGSRGGSIWLTRKSSDAEIKSAIARGVMGHHDPKYAIDINFDTLKKFIAPSAGKVTVKQGGTGLSGYFETQSGVSVVHARDVINTTLPKAPVLPTPQNALRGVGAKGGGLVPKPAVVIPINPVKTRHPVQRVVLPEVSYESSIRQTQVEIASAVAPERQAAVLALVAAGAAALVTTPKAPVNHQVVVENQNPKASQHAEPMLKVVRDDKQLVATKETEVKGEVARISLVQKYTTLVESIGHDPAGSHRQSAAAAHEPMPLGHRGSGHWTPTGPRMGNQLG
jgi:hypothetical protein